jgi:hypothetical protein
LILPQDLAYTTLKNTSLRHGDVCIPFLIAFYFCDMGFILLFVTLVTATAIWLAAGTVFSRALVPSNKKLAGPPTLPLIGNMHQIPRAGIHLQ